MLLCNSRDDTKDVWRSSELDLAKFPGYDSLKAQCEGFKCVVGQKDCCCHHVLFNQPDFCAQKSHLEEYITLRGHICDFYPKYHCELNLLSSIGVLQSTFTTHQPKLQTLMPWNKMSFHALMMFHWFKFKGELAFYSFLSHI